MNHRPIEGESWKAPGKLPRKHVDTYAELSRVLKMHRQTVRDYHLAGVFVRRKRGFHIPSCVAALREIEAENNDIDIEDAGTSSPALERMQRAKAERAEMILESEISGLITRDSVASLFRETHAILSEALLAAPSRVGPVLANRGQADVERLLMEELRRVMGDCHSEMHKLGLSRPELEESPPPMSELERMRFANARLAELDLLKTKAAVLTMDALHEIFYGSFGLLRTAIRALPSRVGPVLTHRSQADVEKVLSGEIERILEDCAKALDEQGFAITNEQPA